MKTTNKINWVKSSYGCSEFFRFETQKVTAIIAVCDIDPEGKYDVCVSQNIWVTPKGEEMKTTKKHFNDEKKAFKFAENLINEIEKMEIVRVEKKSLFRKHGMLNGF